MDESNKKDDSDRILKQLDVLAMNKGISFLLSVGISVHSGTVARDVSLRTAGITCTLLRLWAVPTDVTDTGAVVALAALHAVARQVTDATTGVTRFLRRAAVVERTVATSAAATTTRRLGALASDVTDLAATVALRAGGSSTAGGVIVAVTARAERAMAKAGVIGIFGAVAGDMALLATLVAGLGLGLERAITRDVTISTAVVAGGGALLGAVCRLVAKASTVKTSARASHR
jgi:hypothetical protein